MAQLANTEFTNSLLTYCKKVNSKVVLYKLPPSVYSPGTDQIVAQCQVCKEYVCGQRINDEFVSDVVTFCENHRHEGKEWNMPDIILGQPKVEPTINSDIIKLLARYSNFNVDAQARSIVGMFEYRLICQKCQTADVYERTNFIQWLNRLGYEEEVNPVREFCKRHTHGMVVFVDDIATDVIGRKFRDE